MVWFVIGIVSAAAVIACLIALIRHLLVLGRTAKRMQDELAPIVQEISKRGERASRRATDLGRTSRR